MDFEALKVGNFLLNREGKRTRAKVPVNAGCDVTSGTRCSCKIGNTILFRIGARV